MYVDIYYNNNSVLCFLWKHFLWKTYKYYILTANYVLYENIFYENIFYENVLILLESLSGSITLHDVIL